MGLLGTVVSTGASVVNVGGGVADKSLIPKGSVWKGWEDVLRLIPGKAFDEMQRVEGPGGLDANGVGGGAATRAKRK